MTRGNSVVDTQFLALAQLGQTLAVLLDESLALVPLDGEGRPMKGASINVAPLAKEFRAVIDALVAGSSRDDDDDAFGSDMPAAIRDTKER
jgi:hypothetical protein